MADYPDDLKYHAEHDWARLEGDSATFGITWYAQDSLGEVVFYDGGCGLCHAGPVRVLPARCHSPLALMVSSAPTIALRPACFAAMWNRGAP